VNRLQQAWHDWTARLLALRPGESTASWLLLVAAVVGALAGLASWGFREAIEIVRYVAWSFLPGLLGNDAPPLWLVILPPAIGGLLVGPLGILFPDAARGHGVPEVIEKAVVGGGRIRPRTALVRTIASAITIGSGGSAGREGPIVQIGAAIGSGVAQFLRFSTRRIRVFLGCGAGAGIAAAFHAPLAGAIFALEVILGDFNIGTFSPILIAAAVGTVVSHALEGPEPLFAVPPANLAAWWEYLVFPVFGVACGILGVAFTRLMVVSERQWGRLPLPRWIQPAVGGLLVGLMGWALLAAFPEGTFAAPDLLPFPPVSGNGYGPMVQALHGELPILALLALVGAKMIATAITLGSGGSGGLFAPVFFVGTMAGGAVGVGFAALVPGTEGHVVAYAVVGMAAVAAAFTHAPLTMIFILAEMTGEYSLVLPLMLAAIVASATARRLWPWSVFTAPLAEKGLELRGGKEVRLLQEWRVSELATWEAATVPEWMPLPELLRVALKSEFRQIPVVDDQGRLVGILGAGDLAAVPDDPDLRRLLVARDLMREDPLHVHPDDTLLTALERFEQRDVEALPVVDRERHVLGMITQGAVLRLYHREVVRRALES